MKRPLSRRLRFIGCLAFVGVILLTGCSGPKPASSPAQKVLQQDVPVNVAEAVERDVPVQVSGIGNVEAYSTVTIKSQVDGVIQRAYFTQGQFVKRGDLLFIIDPRPFRAALQQAEATLARDLAQAKNARVQAQRYTRLVQQGIVSKDQYDQVATNAQALSASVQADRATVENAKIQLSYCSINSPIDGRTGSLLVYPGNLVKNNDTSLVVINQVSPIYVDFSVPEQYLADIKEYQSRGRLRVLAWTSDTQKNPSEGVLTFINNTVDSSTGTIMLKGTFSNRDGRLWPGQFVNVLLDLTTEAGATVVPSQAIQTGEQGKYVFVVNPDHSAEVRPVKIGNTVAGMTVIQKGVKPGETVVTNGQLRLYPGAKVTIKSTPASAPESTT